MSDPRHCDACNRPCGLDETCFLGDCTRAICTASEIVCWGDPVDPRTDPRNCGQCGEVCASGKACEECACQEPDLLGDACRSEQLRLWVNAFLPGFIEGGFTRTATVDGIERTIFETETPEGESLILRTDREPDARFPQTPFSPDPDAPGLARIELELALPQMSFTTPEIAAGRVVQLQEVADDTYVTLCERSLAAPLSTCVALSESTGSLIRFSVNCSWSVQKANPVDPTCLLDATTLAPIRIQGDLDVERLDATGLVEIRFTAREEPEENVRVSRFPAFEMYGRLDDGNQVAIFQRAPDGGWTGGSLVEVEDQLDQQCGEEECQGIVARIGCGCGTTCINGKECFVVEGSTHQCRWIDGYYVLTGDAIFEPTNNIVCADPRCPARADCADPCREGYLRADGAVSVLVDGRPVYTSDPFGRFIVPPIGFRARPGARVQVVASDSTNTRDGLRFLSLNRVDGPHGLLAREVRPDTGNRFVGVADGQAGIEIEIQQPRSTQGSTVCCRDLGEQVCVDRMSSTEHCGGCNQPCSDGMLCLAGRCACPLPTVALADACVDPTQDDRHCGPALTDCTLEGKFCAQSSCVSADCQNTELFQVCDGVCVSRNDADRCGYFCNPCPIPPNSRPICNLGVCEYECLDDFILCGSDCVDPTLPQNCGPSCQECLPPVANADATCLVSDDGVALSYQCGHTCLDGFHTCGDQLDCWSNDDPGHCGPSCEQCPSGTRCIDGICCNDPTSICNGVCVDLNTSMDNCGVCNTYCNYNQCCVNGRCGFCDACGGCPSGQDCIDGQCQEPPPPPPPPPPECGCGTWDEGSGQCVYKTCPPFEEDDGT